MVSESIRIRDSIATRLLRMVFSFYLLVAIVVTLIHMGVEYQTEKTNITSDLNLFQKTFEHGLANILWSLDEEQLTKTMASILEIPVIIGIKIENDTGGIWGVGTILDADGNRMVFDSEGIPLPLTDDQPRAATMFEHSFAVNYSFNTLQNMFVGTCTFYSSSDVVLERVQVGFFLLLGNAVIKTVALWVIFLWISQFILARPLFDLTVACRRLDLDSLDQLNINIRTKGKNELKMLEQAFKAMVQKLNLGRKRIVSLRHYSNQIADQNLHFHPFPMAFNELTEHVPVQNGFLFFENPEKPPLHFPKSREGIPRFLNLRPSPEVLSQLFAKNTQQVAVFNHVTSEHSRFAFYGAESGSEFQEGHLLFARTEADDHHLICLFRDNDHAAFSKNEIEYVKSMIGEVELAKASIQNLNALQESEKRLRKINVELENRVAERTSELKKEMDIAKQANQAKSEFLANMSHEIRTPLNAILGFSEILEKKVTDPQEKQDLQSIRTSGKSLLTLINDILDLSKIEAGKLELDYVEFNPFLMFQEIQQIFSHKVQQKGIELLIEIPSDFPNSLVLDVVRLRQILLNLVGNAVKFTSRGEVVLSVQESEKCIHPNRVALIFSVKDSGIGIPENEIESIFGAFEQQKGQNHALYGGTGLGLAITKRLVEMMGGNIAASSVVGIGSNFKIEFSEVVLGNDQELGREIAAPVDLDSIEFAHAVVFNVDDLTTNRSLNRRFLEPYGFEIHDAENGAEVLALLDQYTPDLILMDIKMPVLDGYETIQRIRKNPDYRRIPIIAITASVMKHLERRYQKVFDGYLRKPISRFSLLSELMRFLDHTIGTDSSVEDTTSGETKEDFLSNPPDWTKMLELLDQLESQLPGWEILCRVLIISDIENFAKTIAVLAEEYHVPPLKTWANKLLGEATSFSIETLPTTLSEFTELLDMIRSTAEAESR